ncbi:MAG TPA: DUF6600 domain-containing protein [Chitinophagaceae bacterium]|jgi:hypothetical protein|nr:DUF6600 domain-containing protein [Chitinophagaceae bacterium]
MKRILKMAALALVIMLGSAWRNNAAAQPSADDEVSYQTFYDELSPHGRWVDYPQHGYVWIPDAGPDFRPYSTNGHWVYTDDYEWMWVSDYDWGWAPFHYGRWDHDPYYGWYWVPGYEWSPAWVAWRDGGDYYGWAPIRPGISISINFSIGSYAPPYDFWCFTPRRYITSYNVYNYCMPRTNNITIINQTTIINNYNYRGNVWRTGPRRMDAEVYCGRISSVRFRSMSSPGRSVFRNNEVSVYRPSVRRDERGFAPRTFERYDRNNGRNNNGRIDRRDNNQGNNGRIDTRDRRTGRFEGSNNGNNNGRFERNGAPDNRDRRTNGRIGSNNDNGANNGRTNNGRFERNNTNTPNNPGDTRDRRSNNRLERNGTNTPNPGNNNGANDRRIFERNGNGNGGGNNDGRIRQQRTEQPSQPSTNPRGPGGSNDGRMYRQQRTEQPSQPSTNPGGNGRFDRRMSNPGNQSTQPRTEPRRIENNNRMQMPERRTEQRSAPSSQPRFEPRSNGNNTRSSGNGNGGERSRRGRN